MLVTLLVIKMKKIRSIIMENVQFNTGGKIRRNCFQFKSDVSRVELHEKYYRI